MLLKNPKIALSSAAVLTALLAVLALKSGLIGDIILRLPATPGSYVVSFGFLPLFAVLLSLPGALLMRKAIEHSLLISVVAALEAYWIAHPLVVVLIENYDAWLAAYGALILLGYLVAFLFFRKLVISSTAKASIAAVVVGATAIIADRIAAII
ncbi:hypothetical protein [Streptomyces sp. NPDC048385]|uniref:hypothetical protein n=1 Tax=Streptomyces sp. NPDC048385 TaxID=3155145 RepID=UPI00342AB923